MAGKFGKCGLKALFVSCAFIVRVASQKRQLTIKARIINISVDVAVTINQCSLRNSGSKAQVFKTVKFSTDFIQHKTVKTNDKIRRFGVVIIKENMNKIMQITAFKVHMT